MNLKALYKLFRFKPTIAWTVCGFILAVSVAINEFGYDLNWNLLLYSFITLVLMQGLLAHAINDISDEEVDKRTDIKGTNRFKVLVSGIMSRRELVILSIFILTFSSYVAFYIFYELGFVIQLFYLVGLYAILAYSLEPLKLGWRPFSEWTVVFPTLVTYIVAVNFVATGYLSKLAFYYGIVFALFNILWFIVSRAMDYYPDKESGKITTAVKFGVNEVFEIYLVFIISAVAVYIMWMSAVIDQKVSISFAFLIILIIHLPRIPFRLEPYGTFMEMELSKLRVKGIVISILNSLTLSLLLLYYR